MVVLAVKNPPANAGDIRDMGSIPGLKDLLQEGMATPWHSTILAWRILQTEEPGGLQSRELQRVRHDWSNLACTQVPLPSRRTLFIYFSETSNPCFSWGQEAHLFQVCLAVALTALERKLSLTCLLNVGLVCPAGSAPSKGWLNNFPMRHLLIPSPGSGACTQNTAWKSQTTMGSTRRSGFTAGRDKALLSTALTSFPRAGFFLLNFNPQFFMFFNKVESSLLTFPTSKENKGVNMLRSTSFLSRESWGWAGPWGRPELEVN